MRSAAQAWELQGKQPTMKWYHWIIAVALFGSIPFADIIGNLLYNAILAVVK